jgi:hypothetical protein
MKSERIRTCIETEFAVGKHRGKGRILNVSERGVFVGTGSIPPQGETASLQFRAPGGGPIRLSGLVWWTTDDEDGTRHRETGFGVRLLDDNENFRQFRESLG